MENKRRGRPCKEEKMTNYMIRLGDQDQSRILRLSKKFNISRAEAIRMALEMACDTVFPVDEYSVNEFAYEEEHEEEDDYMDFSDMH